jgi:hypothetical protein
MKPGTGLGGLGGWMQKAGQSVSEAAKVAQQSAQAAAARVAEATSERARRADSNTRGAVL